MALEISILSLMLAALACTSNDTLFIHLTETLTPTVTTTPLTQLTKFKIGEKVNIVSVAIIVDLAEEAGPMGGSMFSSGSCSPNQEVTIEDVSKNTTDPKDPELYYKIACSGSGWVPEYILTHLTQYGTATVASADGKGAMLYSDPDFKSKPVAEKACPDGAKVDILNLTLNPDTAIQRGGETATDPDYNIYVQVTCDGTTGYALEKLLKPTS